MNIKIKKKNVFLAGLFVAGFFLSVGTQKASALNDCTTFKPGWICRDVTASNNIFDATKACVTGHCEGDTNNQCCRQNCEIGESCQIKSAGLTCVARGVCEGAKQCCSSASGASQTSATTGLNSTDFTNPLEFKNVEGFLGGIMSAIQKIIVVLALVFIMIGSVMILSSAGSSGMVEQGKKAITAALVGLALGVAAPSLLMELGKIIGWVPRCDSTDVNCASIQGAITLTQIAINVLNFLLGTMGIVALVMLVIGAIMYLTSAGDEDRIEKGKEIFKYSVIGLVLAMSAMILVTQVAKFFVGGSTATTTSASDFVGPPAPTSANSTPVITTNAAR